MNSTQQAIAVSRADTGGAFYSHRRSSIAVRSKSSANTRNTRARNCLTAFAAHSSELVSCLSMALSFDQRQLVIQEVTR